MRDYSPITCLNTCYMVFTGIVGGCLREHVKRSNISGTWLGTIGSLGEKAS